MTQLIHDFLYNDSFQAGPMVSQKLVPVWLDGLVGADTGAPFSLRLSFSLFSGEHGQQAGRDFIVAIAAS